MRLLVDTHILLWSGSFPDRLSLQAQATLEDATNSLYFSTASIWEMAIKYARRRKDFVVDPALFRQDMLRNGYQELPILSEHALAIAALPSIHKDPFDRILIAQATVEGIVLLTSDKMVGKYPGPIRLI